MEKSKAVANALAYLEANAIAVPLDLLLKLETKGLLRSVSARAVKQAGDIGAINADYHDAITGILTGYFEGAGSVSAPRNQFKQATVEAFGAAFDSGWVDGGQEMPPDADALDWLNARVSAEFGYIDSLFQEAKELRKQADFDYFAWVTAKADGYTNTLKEVYNAARMRAMQNVMVTFDGDDGQESCDTCQMLKGQRHRASWFVAHNYVPPFGSSLDCAKGGHCQHGLMDDKGNWVTV